MKSNRLKSVLLSLLLCAFCQTLFAQENPPPPAVSFHIEGTDTVYTICEEMPAYPGGEEKLFAFIHSNIVYPEKAKESGISGRVYVKFVVDKQGKIKNPKVLRGIGGGADKEVIRVVSIMPQWKPGMHDGKPVMVEYNLPVVFNKN